MGFRAFATSAARRRGIVGEVWNSRDGSVEALIFHEHLEALDGFLDDLRSGPGRVAGVTSIDAPWQNPPPEFRVGLSR